MGVWGKQLELTGEGNVTTTGVDQEGSIVLEITESVHEPIILQHDGNDGMVQLKVTVAPNVEATIIEYVKGTTVHDVQFELGANSEVAHGLIQEGTYRGVKHAVLGRDARMTWFELNTNNAQSRVHTELQEGSFVKSNSIFLGKPGEHIDFGSRATHHGAHSGSQLFTKGVLRGADAIYDGVLDIKSDAPHSQAHQREDCLLLDDTAEIKAAPQLFIDNNEVQCSHACSTTKPDEALSFYVQSRGVPKNISDAMLIKAFVWPVIESLPAHLACRIEKDVEERLAGL